MIIVRDFILSTTGRFYNKTDLKLHDNSEYVLSDFINNSQTLLIQAYEDKNELHLLSKIQKNENKSVIFYKTAALELTHDDSLKDVNIITLSSNATESLYQIIRNIYTPLLAEGDNLHSTKLQKHLSDLESVLRILSYGKGPDNANVILSIEDELEYWQTFQEKTDVSKKEREAAETFSELFEDIAQEIRSMQSSALAEVRESAENIGGILDDVWRTTVFPYSQERMIHMLDIIGHKVCSIIQEKCSGVDLWIVHESKEFEVLTLLSESLKVIVTWTSACKSLTETYWPNYALHPWNGKPYVPLFCTYFQSRLKQINDIRSTHSQLNKLLTRNEQTELQTHALFQPFHNINIWMCNGTNPAWEAAVLKFSADLRPAEMKIAEKLKPRLHNTSTKQMLYEFMRYQALIDRPLVKQALNNELEIFVSSLIAMLKEVQNQLDTDETDVKMYQPPEMSPLVHQVQWAKQMEAKVKEIQMCAEKYLKEFEDSAKLLSLTAQLLKDLKAMYTHLHEEWSRDLQAQSKSGLLQLSADKPVVEFSGARNMMEVKFNPRLVWLQLECRAMAALALPPPAALALPHRTAALAHARTLQQVASFHNTLGERMIPSTRPMMLQAALDLSSLVQDQKAVYWDDIQQLANYTEKLKKAVLKLETQNTYLTNQHLNIRNIVEKLVDTDLLAKQSEWKRAVKDIRNIIEKVESNGYKNTEPWRLHWDWQLYKALECQYIKTLLSLHNYFPHIKVDLVLRGHMVQVQPPMEEIRVQHYNQLRRLVSLPAQFVGLQNNIADSQTIFAAIVDKHSWVGNAGVRGVERALRGVERVRAGWGARAALACVRDLGALCRAHLTAPQHWEHNFKACKAYGQAVAKITFEDEKVEWISIGTATLRREFEAQTRSLWACLMSSLQSSCHEDAATVEAFIANAAVMLENKVLPKNAKELSDISAKQLAIQEKLPEMETLVEDLKKKGHLLRTWGGDTSVDRTIKEWQKIRELMLAQQQMFQHQAEIVKSSLNGEWGNLNTSVEAWVSRWTHSSSRLADTRGALYTDLVSRWNDVLQATHTWEDFQAQKLQLLQECEKFNMKLEVSEIWQQGEKLMKECLDLWGVFKDYNEELDSLAKQDWVVFQKKLHLLDEFTSKWKGALEPYTSVTLIIQQELDKFSDLTPLLKYLRGTDFSERNWREVFSLLEMEYKSPDTLQLKDFLHVASNIKKHIKALQKICTMASNESSIRSALNELEIWFAGARLSIIYYNDNAKRQTPIVKDFKDILTKISEQQWVVSSLSGGGGGGGSLADACAAWESRLRSARTALRAAHHAQRRSAHHSLVYII